jgi:hypothetical protein
MKPSQVNVRAWGGSYPAIAHQDGSVLVWDDVAGHFTKCHSLTPAQERYVRARVSPSDI